MKVIVVTVEDRAGKVLTTSEFTDPQEAHAEIARIVAHCPNVLITRTESETQS